MADKRPITTPSALAELPNTDSLIAGASAVLSEQGSSPATPASGYGIVYAKTDGKLYFKNDAGTETDLTAGGGTNPVIREYTSNDTWTKPTAANFWGALVFCVGAGGGGGSGRVDAASTARFGGGGGGGGSYACRIIRAATLTSASYAITIGAGGAGGAAVSTNTTNGNNGSVGGTTTFGSLVSAHRGNAGQGGTASTGSGGSGGSVDNCTPRYSPYAVNGGSGSASSITTTPGAGGTGLLISGGAGGGAGGGISSTNQTRNGGNGGSIRDMTVTVVGPTGATTLNQDGDSGTNDIATNLLFDIDNSTTNGMGTGGAGGAGGDATQDGGLGGNGGKGAGGGGGGAAYNGFTARAGGTGGDGLCFVVEYYGA